MLSRFFNEHAIQTAILFQHLIHIGHVVFAGYHFMSGVFCRTLGLKLMEPWVPLMRLVTKLSIQATIKNITMCYTCHRHYHFLHMRHSSADSPPTSNSDCIKTAYVLNSQLRDLQHGSTFANSYCEVIILLMKSIGRLKDQVKSVVYKLVLTKSIFIDCMEY